LERNGDFRRPNYEERHEDRQHDGRTQRYIIERNNNNYNERRHPPGGGGGGGDGRRRQGGDRLGIQRRTRR